MGALNTHEEREREIEALRAAISRLSAANLRISECPDLETVLHEALEPRRQDVHQQLGEFQLGAAEGLRLRLRHDHASQFMSDDFQNELAFLGIESSPAFVREPAGNGCIERLFRTLKEQLLRVRHLQSIPELLRALEKFSALYNHHWLIECLGFKPPVQARQRLALKPQAPPSPPDCRSVCGRLGPAASRTHPARSPGLDNRRPSSGQDRSGGAPASHC